MNVYHFIQKGFSQPHTTVTKPFPEGSKYKNQGLYPSCFFFYDSGDSDIELLLLIISYLIPYFLAL